MQSVDTRVPGRETFPRTILGLGSGLRDARKERRLAVKERDVRNCLHLVREADDQELEDEWNALFGR